tara:strand:- start:672 stop:1019 length:348 start_codon:yes stop_codon:yes gene_type:complete
MINEFKFLEGMGINLVPVAVLMTIALSWGFMYLCKDFLAKKEQNAIRTLSPLAIGIAVYLFYVKAKLGLSVDWSIGWDAMVNGLVSTGLYAKVKSYLMSKGFNIGTMKKEKKSKK